MMSWRYSLDGDLGAVHWVFHQGAVICVRKTNLLGNTESGVAFACVFKHMHRHAFASNISTAASHFVITRILKQTLYELFAEKRCQPIGFKGWRKQVWGRTHQQCSGGWEMDKAIYHATTSLIASVK